jgi:hypothetical protein
MVRAAELSSRPRTPFSMKSIKKTIVACRQRYAVSSTNGLVTGTGRRSSKPLQSPGDGRHAVKGHAYRPDTLYEVVLRDGARRVSPSLTVATCDYAGRSYGWEPLSGQLEMRVHLL